MTIENSSSPKTDKEALALLLRQGNATVTFTKRDGTERVMKCTLQESTIVPYERKTNRIPTPNDEVLPVWDLEASAWRSIPIDGVKSIAFDLGVA
jgi:hypothetical protein